jgi:DNA-binding transcriptional LysR family regulator
METRQLRYFVALAEELHFARAAARVGIEQAPLSKAISNLEQRLGVQLFLRTRRSTTLTAVGDMLLQDARRILAEIDRAHRNITSAASGRQGRIRVALCDGLAHPRIAGLLAQVRQDDPNVDIELTHHPTPDQLRGLHSGTIDIGFSLTESSDLNLRCLPLWQDPLVIIVRPDNPMAALKCVEEIDPQTRGLIVLGTAIAPAAKMRKPIEHVASTELLLTLVATGHGAGLLSAAQAQTIHRPDLVVRPLHPTGPRVTTFLLQRSSGASEVVARFTERAIRAASSAGAPTC